MRHSDCNWKRACGCKDEQIGRKGGVVIQDAKFEVTCGNITNVRTHEPWNRPSLNVVSYGYRMNGDTGNRPMEWDCKEIRFMLSVHGKNLYYVGLLKLKPYNYLYDWNEWEVIGTLFLHMKDSSNIKDHTGHFLMQPLARYVSLRLTMSPPHTNIRRNKPRSYKAPGQVSDKSILVGCKAM